ncbi:anti-sigma factor domain-containing protein [Streptomyces sp. NPDC053513]|uniref:anti-sigma factor n=1 Tax=unclassified Streptomyces TaxID=2593676 RepID=UPI0037CE9DBA
MAGHLGADELIDLVLAPDGPLPPRAREHLDRCPRCRRELDELRAVVRAARAVATEDVLAPPPDRVWRAIAAELDLGAAHRGGPSDPHPADPRKKRRDEEPTPAGTARDRPPGTGLPPRRRRTWPSRRALLPAAVCLAVGAAVGSSVTWWQLDDDRPGVAAAPLSRLTSPGTPAVTGTAQVVGGPGTGREVRVSVSGLPKTDGYFEVWLMDRSHRKLIAVGTLGPDGGATLPLPEGVDLSGYPVIDVSAQRYDGNPAHSGESVARGDLDG